MSIINRYPLSAFEVLLVESDQKKILHRTYILFQNSYRVSSAMNISEALSKINRQTFDCVVVDAESHDMNLKEFFPNIWIHQPKMRIIVINSNECHMQLVNENLKNKAIWFLRKPTVVTSICNTLQHVRLSKALEGTSTGKPLEENQKGKFVQNAPSPTIFNLMINNNTSSSNGTHQGLNINKQKCDAMCKRVSHVDISSDDDVDEASTFKSIRTGTTEIKDRGKKPMELKRKSEPQAEVDINLQRRKDIISRVTSTPTPFRNYFEPLASFGKEGAHPKEIRNPINMPDCTRAQVASPLHEVVLGSMKKNTDWQIESYKFKTSGQSTAYDNNASMQNSSSIQRAINHNSNATSIETFDQIMAWGGPRLSLPPCTTTLIGNTFMSSDFALTGNSHSGGNEGLQAPFNSFGIPEASNVTVGGGGGASSYAGLDDVTLPQFTFQDLEDVFHPQPFLGIGEALVGFVNSGTVKDVGQASTSVSPPGISGVENNSAAEPSGDSILPFHDSEGRVIDNDWYLSLIHDFDL